MKVKFYYPSKDSRGDQYPCNIAACLEKVKTLKGLGEDVEAIDVAGVEYVYRCDHAALTGPPATVRAVFGMKGALDLTSAARRRRPRLRRPEGPLPDERIPAAGSGPGWPRRL